MEQKLKTLEENLSSEIFERYIRPIREEVSKRVGPELQQPAIGNKEQRVEETAQPASICSSVKSEVRGELQEWLEHKIRDQLQGHQEELQKW